MTALIRAVVMAGAVMMLWWGLTASGWVPDYMLPPPDRVAASLWQNHVTLSGAALTTGLEAVGGLVLGTLLGAYLAVVMVLSPTVRRWTMPFILLSQAVPTFAIAPVLVLWFGFGVASKIIMAMLVIFFPVASTFFDGLRQTPAPWLDLAQTMNATKWRTFRYIRLPAALPAFASGLRMAAAVAPIGAVVGEWVGASSGLGYLMLMANSRFDTPLMFAALFILTLMTLLVWGLVDGLLRRLVPPQSFQ